MKYPAIIHPEEIDFGHALPSGVIDKTKKHGNVSH